MPILARTVAVAFAGWLLLVAALPLDGEIPKPTDAPAPLSPEASAKTFRLPEGFKLELIAAEPLIHEPSGVCWDARGRLFVCELHGYNVEGQLDIEELNKTGQLDRVVRRLDADERFKTAAKQATFGTVKLLSDTDGDGRMDRADVWADQLTPCYGICPAREGVIVACAPDVVFLADRDGDGKAEIRETLLTGFATGALERGINCPQWGLDDWIYFGRGHGGGHITGPHLARPVDLPSTDFRIKSDGSAIEPISGTTDTIGLAFTERGDRFVIGTRSPAIQVAPLPWNDLARNRDLIAPELQQSAVADGRCYPASRPHPWRTRRADDPGFSKYYADKYGQAESAPNGYFTSACGPLVYQGSLLKSLEGQLLACEPAQNFVYRGVIRREGPKLRVARPVQEEKSEFLASTDGWFHPMALAHAPDDSVAIVDFYREIIEDYSAIPRYLQQQYELTHGQDRGRIWRLTSAKASQAQTTDLTGLSVDQLVAELAGGNFWRRRTAQRLLTERRDLSSADGLRRLIRSADRTATKLSALYTLADLEQLTADDLLAALAASDAGIRVNALRLVEPWLDRDPRILDRALTLAADDDETVALQVALTLGSSRDARIAPALAALARAKGDIRWIDTAILSSLAGRGSEFLVALLADPKQIGQARDLLAPLSATIAAGRDPDELSRAVLALAGSNDPAIELICLKGLRSSFSSPTTIALAEPAAAALKMLAAQENSEVAAAAKSLVQILRLESPGERSERLNRLVGEVTDIQLPLEARLAAVAELAIENEAEITGRLLAAVTTSTPQVRDAILGAVFSRREQLPAVLAAIESGALPAAVLSAVQRTQLAENPDPAIRAKATPLLAGSNKVDPAVFARYAAALKLPRDPARGGELFRQHCGKCHAAHGVGVAVGPDLSAEFQRAEETILLDILTPSSSLTSGYVTYVVATNDGRIIAGLLASEAANSVTIKLPEGKTEAVLRKDIDEFKASSVSLMPDNLTATLAPQDVADILTWIRTAAKDKQPTGGPEPRR